MNGVLYILTRGVQAARTPLFPVRMCRNLIRSERVLRFGHLYFTSRAYVGRFMHAVNTQRPLLILPYLYLQIE